MSLSLGDIQRLDNVYIWQYYLPLFEKIYGCYKYCGISMQEYTNIVFKLIENSKTNYKGKSNYSNYIKQKVVIEIAGYIKEKLNSNDTAVVILNNYINTFDMPNNCNEAINIFDKINNFLKSYNYTPNPDLLIDLLKTNITLEKMSDLVVTKYSYNISNGYISELFDNDVLIQIIEVYCEFKKIDFNEKDYDDNTISNLNCKELEDSLKLYLDEAAKYSLLTYDEEIELAKRIASGDETARKRFIESNLRLVVFVAEKYIGRGIEFKDLVQEGNIGLIKAVEKYDPNRGYRFSTYAAWWIRQTIINSIYEKGRCIKIPFDKNVEINKYKMVQEKMENELGRKPTTNEMSERLGITVKEVQKLQELQYDIKSLNQCVGEEKDTEFGEFISSLDLSVEEINDNNLLPIYIQRLFVESKLSPREIRVLTLKYGLNTNAPLTLADIAREDGVTRERIRQVEARAIEKIRKSNYINNLAIYMQYPDEAKDRIKMFKNKYLENKSTYKKYAKIKEPVEEVTIKEEVYDIYDIVGWSEEKIDIVFKKYVKFFKKGYEEKIDRTIFSEENKQHYLEVLKRFKPEEALAIALKLGLIYENEVCDEVIGYVLGYEEFEILYLTKKYLNLYRLYLEEKDDKEFILKR